MNIYNKKNNTTQRQKPRNDFKQQTCTDPQIDKYDYIDPEKKDNHPKKYLINNWSINEVIQGFIAIGTVGTFIIYIIVGSIQNYYTRMALYDTERSIDNTRISDSINLVNKHAELNSCVSFSNIIDVIIKDNQRIRIYFNIQNVGKTPAIHIKLDGEFIIVNNSIDVIMQNTDKPINIKQGKNHTHGEISFLEVGEKTEVVHIGEIITPKQYKDIMNKVIVVYFYCIISYINIFREENERSFLLQYNVDEKKFIYK